MPDHTDYVTQFEAELIGFARLRDATRRTLHEAANPAERAILEQELLAAEGRVRSAEIRLCMAQEAKARRDAQQATRCPKCGDEVA